MYLALLIILLPLILFTLVKILKIKVEGVESTPIYFSIRTKHIVSILEKIAVRSSNIINDFGRIAIYTTICMIIFYFYFFFFNFFKFLFKFGETSKIILLYPGLTINIEESIYFLISVGLSLILHETAHALQALSHNIEVRRFGVGIFLGLIYGFVEIDDKALMKVGKDVRRKIYSSGPFTNLVIALAAFLLISSVYQLGVSGILVIDTMREECASLEGKIITRINDIRITNVEDFLNFMESREIGEVVKIETVDGETYFIRLGERLGKGFLGVACVNYNTLYYNPFFKLLIWLGIININLAILNAAPFFITDGGKFVREFRIKGEIINYLGVAILLLNMIVSGLG